MKPSGRSDQTPEFSLDNKVLLVTGAAGLIGTEICDAFASYGGALILTDLLPPEELERRANGIRERHPKAEVLAVSANLTGDEDVERLVAASLSRFDQIDVLVNLAAIDAKFDAHVSTVEPSRFESFPLQLWEKSVAVNCTGMIRITQAVVRPMLRRHSGNIINVASTYSLVAPNQGLYRYRGEPGQKFKPVDYVGTKSMVPNLTRYLATLYARDGIRCNAIAPHGVDNNHPQKFRDNFATLSPLGRLCDVRELRGPFVFLASGASSYMTGATMVVDGGWTAW